MKKILFAFPAIALAVFLTYCAKESSAPSSFQVGTEVIPAGDRATCNVTITPSGAVQICGLGGFGSCTNCSGTANLPGSVTGTGPFNFTNTPGALGTPFVIKNLTAGKITVKVETSAVCGIWVIAPGGCLDMTLATTCYLLSSVAADTCP